MILPNIWKNKSHVPVTTNQSPVAKKGELQAPPWSNQLNFHGSTLKAKRLVGTINGTPSGSPCEGDERSWIHPSSMESGDSMGPWNTMAAAGLLVILFEDHTSNLVGWCWINPHASENHRSYVRTPKTYRSKARMGRMCTSRHHRPCRSSGFLNSIWASKSWR